jgi:hypothetical protein
MLPQFFPWAAQVVGVQQVLLLVQTWPVRHVPQLSVPPQPLEIVPQFFPWAAHVVGVQQVPLLHTCPDLQQLVPQVKAGATQVQVPLTQVKLVPHTWPHVPQLCGSVPVLTQVPAQQVVPIAHLCPQAPQLALLVWRLTHVPEHSVVPAGQGQIPFVHVPLQHGLVELQAAPAAAHRGGAGAVVVDAVVAVTVGAGAEDDVAAEDDVDVGADVGVGVGVESASASVNEGKTAAATPAARILRAVRRERGLASLLARSSKRSALMASLAQRQSLTRSPLGQAHTPFVQAPEQHWAFPVQLLPWVAQQVPLWHIKPA